MIANAAAILGEGRAGLARRRTGRKHSLSPSSRRATPPICSDLICDMDSVWDESFVPRYALVRQTAFVGAAIHQDTAFLTGHAIRGCFDHGDFVFCSAVAFMRSGEPFYEFGHARNMRLSRSRSTPLRLICTRDKLKQLVSC